MMQPNAQSISVILPTFRRPDFLNLCLQSLASQTTPPSEVLVSVTLDDIESRKTALAWEDKLPIQLVEPIGRGVIGAMNSCLDISQGTYVLLVDDDVELPPTWVEQMLAHLFSDPNIVGAGGRDLLLDHPEFRANEKRLAHVGIVEPWGRIVGNHHRGAPPARRVRILRGSNCLYRGDFLRRVRFDEDLRGKGAQVHWELSLAFAVWQAGLSLFYDPTVEVLHHVAPRHDGDGNHRGIFDPEGIYDMTFNEVLIVLRHAPLGIRERCLCWNFLVGSVTCPGLLQIPRLIVERSPHLFKRALAAWRGRFAALAAALNARRVGV